ncbi:MAG: hypothetical protein OXC55_02510 [Chloroflexi bacterium]|nr:hypothetical protein [Chloroflexota bacterium]
MQTRMIALAGIACLVFLASIGNANAQEEENITLRYASMSEGEIARDSHDNASFASLPEVLQQSLLSCSYETKGDYPHTSNSDTEASAHGWWTVDDDYPSDCPQRADVEVELQAKVCAYDRRTGELKGCFWDTLDRKEKRIRPGGGAGKRTIARHDCIDSDLTYYRSIVDVDLVDTWDLPFKVTNAADLECLPRP